ncbi:unnamed protein product [Adineta steineri]|uniref:Uncharacterized protein n=1 Tax=Adineta steineri TaxID=433720 RepID=A0A818UW25_9BILA|nr:unnamed protein product [Adineta steineri]CAF3703599.1 unnamed protein product [Adineta steineri]
MSKRQFSDVLYTQEDVYPMFSNGKMSVGETYVALALGFLDPCSLPPMVIFSYNNQQWGRDTRRLSIARALENKGYNDASKKMQVIDVDEDNEEYKKQYDNLIKERIRSMKSKKLNGKNVKICSKRGLTCCFNDQCASLFRDDIITHMAWDHLHVFPNDLLSLDEYYCEECKTQTQLQLVRKGTRKQRNSYTIQRECGCRDDKRIELPWQEVSLTRVYNELRKYKENQS